MTVRATLRRDRAVWIAYAAIAMWGYVLYAMGPALSSLRQDLGVSRTQIGLAGTALALGSIAAALGAPRLLAGLSQRVLVCTAIGAIGLAALGLATATALWWVLAAAGLLGVGGALATIIVPVIIESRQPTARAVALTEANFFAGLCGAVSPLAIGLGIAVGAGWSGGLLAGTVAAGIAVWFGRTLPDPPRTRGVGEVVDTPDTGGFGAAFWRWLAALVCGVAAEFCVSFWAADYMAGEVGLATGTASGLLTVFVAGIALGRLVGGRLAARRDPARMVAASFATLLAGALVFWAWATPAGSVAGLALLGLGVSVIYPLCLSLTIAAVPAHLSARATTRASLGTSAAILAAPFVLGALGDAIGPRRGFALVPAIAVVALALVGRGGRRST